MLNINFARNALWSGLVTGSLAMATGFEKNVLWSGHYTAIGGAASSSVNGPQALYFNPAGLGGLESVQLSLQASPTWVRFEGPALEANKSVKSKNALLPIGGLFAAYGVTPELGLGLGYYASGGASAKYTNLDPTSLGYENIGKLENSVKLQISELSLGAGYKLNKNFKIGAAWRAVFVRAAFASIKETTVGVGQVNVSSLQLLGLKQNKFNGYRLGAQYRSDDERWGLGLSVRGPVAFKVKGQSAGRSELNVVPTAKNVTGGEVSIKNTFPLQVSLGGDFKVGDKWTIFPEYTYSRYSSDRELEIDGTITTQINTTNVVSRIPNINQEWKDAHAIRLGGQYDLSPETALRAGYVIVTPAVQKKAALPTLATPGIGHSLVAGAGFSGWLPNFIFDAGAEYSWASAKVGTENHEGKAGKYASRAIAIHLGADYKF